MRAPTRTPLIEFVKEYSRNILIGVCPACGTRLRFARCFVSIHATEFGDTCAGEGRCIPVEIPYCAKCEQPPATTGCAHDPLLNNLVTPA
jgi:hypothetical protein